MTDEGRVRSPNSGPGSVLRRSATVALVGLGLLGGCGRSKTPYDHAMDRAESSLERRDFEGTLASWTKAAEISETDDDRQEALYRRAHLLLRLGSTEDARLALRELVVKFPDGARSARILLDLGRLSERRGLPDEARADYATLLERYPESGSAKAALERALALHPDGPLAAVDAWSHRISSPALRSYLRFRRARALLETNVEEALTEFERLASAEPLPGGLYTDEALLEAARLRASRGEIRAALAHLAVLEAAIEDSWFVGSYRRPSYAEGLLLAGRLAREAKDEARAMASFETLVREFPTSRLADDAAYERLLTRLAFGRGAEGCSEFEDFVEDFPESRFRRCRERICGGTSPAPGCAPDAR